MPARILDGRAVAQAIRAEVATGVARMTAAGQAAPGLAVVQVGDVPASSVYVRTKMAASKEAGIRALPHHLPATTTQADLTALVRKLSAAPEVDGILVQMPLPDGIDARAVLEAVDPAKDVDGFHPLNVGHLWSGGPGFAPCTPLGVIELLDRSGIEIEGAEVVVLGRSNIVGKPMAALLARRNATVTICHSRTRDLARVTSRADIVVAAIGKPAFVTSECVRAGAVVIDVGINKISDVALASELFAGDADRLEEVRRKGYTLAGDTHPTQMLEKAGAWSPVPGGVGPLTVALLLRNTLQAAQTRRAG
jgi:methylenetetrahydrofolate dehydrogenase (NADP+)/methenyltetrahydrofolate cyclohydrolase